MSNFKTEFKALYKAYNKKLKLHHKNNFNQFFNNMDYFVTYLKFIRDYYILTEPLVLESGEENLKIAALATAISEYNSYKNCINNYYTSTGIRKIDGTAEEVQQQYNTEKAFHWNNFWTLVMTNMEGWMNNA